MKSLFKSGLEIKGIFTDFFTDKDHQLIGGSSILPVNDPTLMFINSGMAPLKPYFLGLQKAPYPRLTNIQDCIRYVDLEDVGDSHHGTNFQMMGSWSFGDYFKQQAIEFAFELITEKFKIPSDRLFATVYQENESLPGVPSDEESYRVWEKFLPTNRVLWRPPSDNFWGPPGKSGPCGPCTEIFFDRGEKYATEETDDALIKGRHIEIWNAGVFMQYNKDEEGNITNLPMKCVDTGAGYERFAMILQDRDSIHEIDQFEKTFATIHESVGDIRWTRIIQDHLKTAIMMMRVGVTPSNTREGYLLRRVLRRIFVGMNLKGADSKGLSTWIDHLCETIDNQALTRSSKQMIDRIVKSEKEGFERLMQRSRKSFDSILNSGHLSPQQAFSLKSGQGIPEDLIEEFCVENGIRFPKAEFFRLIEEHKNISRQKK